MISPWPSASEVEPQHRNTIVITVVYTYDEEGNEKLLRKFPSDIICQERENWQTDSYSTSYPVFPLSFYDPNVFFIKLVYDYSDLKENKLTEEELLKMPKNSVVFKRFEREQSVGCEHYICGCL